MKSEKENYYIKEILKILVQGDIVATGKIASMIALSEKATRNKLEHLQNYLQENQLGSIEKKPRVGIWLNMNEEQKEKMLRLLDGAEHFSVGYDATQRVRETLQIFFRMMPRETITTQKLAEELYLSPPTVLKVIKDCEKWLRPYGIEINNERSRGCSLKYDETSYRIALKDYIMLDHDLDETRRQTQEFFSNIDIDLIKKQSLRQRMNGTIASRIHPSMKYSFTAVWLISARISVHRLESPRRIRKFWSAITNIRLRLPSLKSCMRKCMSSSQMRMSCFWQLRYYAQNLLASAMLWI